MPTIKWTNGAKLYFSSFQNWYPYQSFGQKSSSAIPFTLSPIQEMRLLHCQLQHGKCTLNSSSTYFHLIFFFHNFWTWRFPFDWENPFGYLNAVMLEYLFTICIASFIGSLAILGISSYLLGIAIVKDMKYNLYLMNDNAKIKAKRLITVEQFSDFIKLHSMAKKLSGNFHNPLKFTETDFPI